MFGKVKSVIFAVLFIRIWMKNVAYLIGFVCMFLIGSKTMTEMSFFTEEEGEVCVCQSDDTLQDSASESYFLSITKSPLDYSALTETEILARQLTMSGRVFRQNLSQTTLFSKTVQRVAMMRMKALAQSAIHLHSTYPCRRWKVSSEHYVFGMRHILI